MLRATFLIPPAIPVAQPQSDMGQFRHAAPDSGGVVEMLDPDFGDSIMIPCGTAAF